MKIHAELRPDDVRKQLHGFPSTGRRSGGSRFGCRRLEAQLGSKDEQVIALAAEIDRLRRLAA